MTSLPVNSRARVARRATAGVAALTLALSGLMALAPLTPASAAPTTAPTPTTSDTLALDPAMGDAQVAVGGRTLVVKAALPRHHTRSFSTLAVTWTGQTGAEPTIQYRTLTGGQWTAWSTTTSDGEGRSNGMYGTDPLYVGDSTGAEVRVLGDADSSVTGLKVRLIDPKKLSSDAQVPTLAKQGPGTSVSPAGTTSAQAAAATVGVPKPTVISRAQWGANESLLSTNGSSCVPPAYDSTIKAVIVHHTAGTNDYTAAQSASIVRGIYYYHVVSRGWCDVGYNVLVDKYGQVFEGRHGGLEFPVHGAHATSWNTDTLGISVMMNSSEAKQSDAAMTSVTNVIAWKLANNYRSATDKLTLAGKSINRIARHGDVMATDCPGTNITAYMPTLRGRVAAIMAAAGTTPIQDRWNSMGGDASSLGAPYILERNYNGGRITTFAKGSMWMTPSRQVFWAGSSIAAKYSAVALQAGWPTADQQPLPFGNAAQMRVGNGAVVTSPKGTFWVQSTIWAHLAANPDAFASLGAPIADQTTENGKQLQRFTYGTASIVGGQVVIDASGAPAPPPPVFPKGYGDRTGDGLADLVGVTASGALVTIATKPTLTADSPVVRATGFTDVDWLTQVADLDGNGTTEVLLRRTTDGSLWLLHGLTSGGFGTPIKVGIGWNGMRNLVMMGDMTGDGRPELLAIDAKQNLYRYSFVSANQLTAKTLVGVSWGSMRLTVGFTDFTGDGTPDLLAVNAAGELWDYSWQPARGGWVWKKVGIGWSGISNLAVPGDVNGDGRVDLMATWASTGDVQPFLNAGGAWSKKPIWGTTKGYLALG